METLFISIFVLTGITALVTTSAATPPSGVTSTVIATSNLTEPVQAEFMGEDNGLEISRIVTVKFEVEPAGSFGWHQHGGPVWAVVNSGSVTVYDESCQPQVYQAPNTMFDSGNETHIAINEGSIKAEIFATFMLPEGGEPRIDVTDPGTCPAVDEEQEILPGDVESQPGFGWLFSVISFCTLLLFRKRKLKDAGNRAKRR